MEEKIILDKSWVQKYKELRIELALIEEEIRGIEDYSVLFLDEILSIDTEIEELETEKQEIKKLPKELKKIKSIVVEGAFVSFLSSLSLSVFSTPDLHELTEESLVPILIKFGIIMPLLESIIMIPSVKEIIKINKKIKDSDEKILEIDKKIYDKQNSRQNYSVKRNSDLEIIEKLNLEKKLVVAEIYELINTKYEEELNQEEIKEILLHPNFVDVLESNMSEYNDNIEKILIKKVK